MRGLRRLLLAALTALPIGTVTAQSTPVAGIDYRALKPQASADAQQSIEVVEFFWYRCPHCYALEPLLEPWVARLPRHARFKRVPAILGREWAIDARVFYALEALGEVERLHRPLLDAIHTEGGRRLDRDAYSRWVSTWLTKQGVDPKAYAAAFDSPGVQEKVRKAAEMARVYQLEGTPTFVVGERYVVSPPLGDRRRILEITDYLVSQVQAETLARR
jgi:thiol:disulfide interchange protein DsbA